MGKISTYTVLSTPTVNDKLIGTDVTTNNETKNFLVSDLLALSEGNVGKLLGGGIVVAEWNENGVKKALIASLTDLSVNLPWTVPAFQGGPIIGLTAQSYSNGLTNTNAIIAQTGAPAANTYAAGIARLYLGGGFNDWYLPSQWELNLCYQSAAIVNKVLGVSSFGPSQYWCSTEYFVTDSFTLDFLQSFFSPTAKNLGNNVRAVRIHNI